MEWVWLALHVKTVIRCKIDKFILENHSNRYWKHLLLGIIQFIYATMIKTSQDRLRKKNHSIIIASRNQVIAEFRVSNCIINGNKLNLISTFYFIYLPDHYKKISKFAHQHIKEIYYTLA